MVYTNLQSYEGNKMSTCSYCYNYGHNRRGCPQRKTNLKRDADNGCEYSQRELDKKVTRRCSFCRETGHDKRKCANLKTSFASLEDQIYMGLIHVSRAFNQCGLTPGALVQAHTYGFNEESRSYGYRDEVGILTTIKWGEITPEDLRNTHYRTPSLCVTTTSGEQLTIEPPHHIFALVSDRKDPVTILMEGERKQGITPERQHATDITRRYFEDKDFTLYNATSYIRRFEQYNTEYAARIESTST